MQNVKLSGRGLATLAVVLAGAAGGGIPAPARAQVVTGSLAGDAFGTSVAWAGDVNQDGYADFLVGSPGGRGAAGVTGTASLFLGTSTGFPGAPALVLEGAVGGDAFGYAVAGAGDVNGDGFDDFLVGAPRHDAAGLEAGRAYLFLGGAVPDATPDRQWDGGLSGAAFGFSLAGGFDFNGDGISDFAVGAPESNTGATRAGRVQIFLGHVNPASIASPPALWVGGDAANWGLGYALHGVGDVNGDGFEELAAGAPQLYDVNPGRVVVLLGQACSSCAPAERILVGESGSDRFGFSLSGAGDVNEDGYDDVLVGAPGHDSQGSDKGAVYLFHGGAVADAVHDWRVLGAVGGDSLGYAVAGGFDLDEDQAPDWAAGAPGADVPATQAGAVHLFLGQSYPAPGPDVVLTPMTPAAGFEADDRVGAALRFAPSLDGDPYDDLLVGAPGGNAPNGAPTGYVGLVPGVPGETPVHLLEFTATRSDPGVEIRWRLAEAEELSGVRIAADRGSGWELLHTGWLPADVSTFRDDRAGSGFVRYRLEGLDRAGQVRTLGVHRLEALAPRLGGLRARANPFRAELTLLAGLPVGPSRVRVLDLHGREVRILWAGSGIGEDVELRWDGRDAGARSVPPGVYFISLEGPAGAQVLKTLRLP